MQPDNSMPLLRRRRQLRPSTQRRAALVRAAPFAVAISVGILMLFMLSGRTGNVEPSTTQQRRAATFVGGLTNSGSDRMQKMRSPSAAELQTLRLLPSATGSPMPSESPSATPTSTPSLTASATPAPSTVEKVNNVAIASPEVASEPSPSVEALPDESIEPTETPAPKRLSFWFSNL